MCFPQSTCLFRCSWNNNKKGVVFYGSDSEHTVATSENKDESHQCNLEWKEPDTKEYTLYESIYVKWEYRQRSSIVWAE